jgi:uncharacterized coiled-coil DUF342 family protein
MDDQMPEQFYTKKEIYERFSSMFDDLKGDLAETRSAVKKYNGLHEKVEKNIQVMDQCKERLDKQINRCNEVQAGKVAKASVADYIVKLWPVVLMTIIFILSRM